MRSVTARGRNVWASLWLRVIFVIMLMSACQRNLPRYGSTSPKGCDVIVGYKYPHPLALHARLYISISCGMDAHTIFSGTDDWRPQGAEFVWSGGFRVVTIAACGAESKPVVLSWDTQENRIIDSPDARQMLRANVRHKIKSGGVSNCPL